MPFSVLVITIAVSINTNKNQALLSPGYRRKELCRLPFQLKQHCPVPLFSVTVWQQTFFVCIFIPSNMHSWVQSGFCSVHWFPVQNELAVVLLCHECWRVCLLRSEYKRWMDAPAAGTVLGHSLATAPLEGMPPPDCANDIWIYTFGVLSSSTLHIHTAEHKW